MEETEWMKEHRLAEEKRKCEYTQFIKEHNDWRQKEEEKQRKEEAIKRIVFSDFKYQQATNFKDRSYIEYNIRLKYADVYGMPRREDYLPWEYPGWDRPLYNPDH